MPEQKIQTLPEHYAIDQIVETIQQADKGEAPFALVLGSGFSHGLVPTTRELVSESLPLWIKSLKEGEPFESQTQLPADERIEIARIFWQEFVDKNTPPPRGLNLPLNSISGLPEDNSEAYKAAFSPAYTGAVGAPAQARKFQRALMQLNRPRLNAAHFLLASLLGVQPGKARASNLFKAHAAFCRLILTTNFDPFLQTALQAVNRLYFMSDTPELGVSDDIFDDQTDAIHLVYLHGSIHRRSQAATDDDIRALKEKNARILAPVLKRHGVIVLGYSGWDDAIVEALAACDRFDNRLYWCGLEPDPLMKGAFGPRVADILRKPAALYVQSAGAGSFMALLLSRLVKGLPRLLDNPIGQLRDLLDIIDLEELAEFKQPASTGPNAPQLLQSGSTATAFVQAKQSTIERLKEAEQLFLGMISSPTESDKPVKQLESTTSARKDEERLATEAGSDSKIQQLLSSAQLAFNLGNYEECLKSCNEALMLTNLDSPAQARFLTLRALAHYFVGDVDAAVVDWSQVIGLADAPVAEVADAIVNRGITRAERGELDEALDDFNHLIEDLSVAPEGNLASALVSRGWVWREKGETQKAITDYNRVIDQMPDAPLESLAQALVNRGGAGGPDGDYGEKAMADFNRVIDQMPDAPIDVMAQALVSRGIAWGKKGDTEREIADYSRVIEHLPGAPIEQVAAALTNRGLVLSKKENMEQAIADYTTVIEQLSNAPVSHVANALANRGWANYRAAKLDLFLADTEAALSKDPNLSTAAFNYGLALLALGRDEDALKAYLSAGEKYREKIDEFGLTDLKQASQQWLTEKRAQPVVELLEALRK